MRTSAFARTPEPPYYAVIFTSSRSPADSGYDQMAARMAELAARQPGYLGVESVRDAKGIGITVSYWASLEAITAWKANVEHVAAQQMGKRVWYEHYEPLAKHRLHAVFFAARGEIGGCGLPFLA